MWLEEEVLLTFTGGSIAAPAFCEPTRRYILERSRFRIGGIPETLTEEARVALCRRLARGGLLRVIDEAVRRPSARAGP